MSSQFKLQVVLGALRLGGTDAVVVCVHDIHASPALEVEGKAGGKWLQTLWQRRGLKEAEKVVKLEQMIDQKRRLSGERVDRD